MEKAFSRYATIIMSVYFIIFVLPLKKTNRKHINIFLKWDF